MSYGWYIFMSTLDVASVLIATMVNWVTCLAYVLFFTFTTFNEVYYITSFACRVLSQCYRFSCSVDFSCSCKFPVYFATFTSNIPPTRPDSGMSELRLFLLFMFMGEMNFKISVGLE